MKARKLYLSSFMSVLLAHLFLIIFTSASIARVTPLAFKGITHHFEPGKEFYSPTLGMAALDSGLIYNLRFYGNFQPQYKVNEEGQTVRDFIKDVSGNIKELAASPSDPLWNLVKALFPSSSGDLTTQTNGSNNFGKHVTSPKTVALLLYFAHQIRTTGNNPPLAINATQQEAIKENTPAVNQALRPVEKARQIPQTLPIPMNVFSTYVSKGLVTPTPEQMNQLNNYENVLKNLLQLKLPAGQLKLQLQQFNRANQIKLTDPTHIKTHLNLIDQQKTQPARNKTPPKQQGKRENLLGPFLDAGFNSLQLTETTDKTNLKSNVKKIFDSIQKSIEQEATTSFYPRYTTEQVILAFFCEHFDTQESIFDLLRTLADLDKNNELINSEKRGQLKGELPGLITEADLQAIAARPTHNMDDFYALTNADIFDRVMPYKAGEQPVSNGTTYAYDRLNNNIVKGTTFADCVEISLRHIMNLMLYDPISRQFNLTSLASYVNDTHSDIVKGHFQQIKAFYANQSPSQANAGSATIRSSWNTVPGDLNAVDGGIPYTILYNGDSTYNYELKPVSIKYEMEPGFINMVNVFRKILDVQLPPPLNEKLNNFDHPQSTFEEKKLWIKAYFQEFFNILNPGRTYTFDDDDLIEGKQQGQLEVFGKLKVKVTEKESGKDMFSFVIEMERGHGELNDLKDKRIESKDYPLPDITKMHFQDQTSLNSLKLLAPNLQEPLKETLYRLYPSILQDNDAEVAAIKMLAELSLQAQNIFDKSLIKSIMGNVLDELSWDDENTVEQVSPVLLELNRMFPDILKNHVQGFASSALTTEGVYKVLADFPKIKFLYLQESLDLEELSLSDLENLQELDLSTNEMKSLKLANMKALRVLNLDFAIELKELSLVNLENLKSLIISDTPLTKIEGLENLTSLKKLSMADTAELQEVFLGNLVSLEELYVQKSGVRKIHGLENLKALKIFDLTGAKSLEELSLINLVNLHAISLSGCSLLNVHGLEDLPALKILKLEGSEGFQELTLNKLVNLQELYLSKSTVTKLHGLENLKVLSILDLSHTPHFQELVLRNIDYLEQLSLTGSAVSKVYLENLRTLPRLQLVDTKMLQELVMINLENLKTLNLNTSGVARIAGLEKLRALKELDLGYTANLQELRLDNLENLFTLNLRNSMIAQLHLENLGALNALNTIEMKNLQEVSMNAAGNIEDLNLALSPVQKVHLEKMPLLRKLDLKSTKNLQEVFLDNLDALSELSLGASSVHKIYLHKLPALEQLKLQFLATSHGLGEVFMSDLANLKVFFLLSNKVKKIHLENLQALQKIELKNVKSIQDLFVSNLDNLQELYFSGSPQFKLPLENLPQEIKVTRK